MHYLVGCLNQGILYMMGDSQLTGYASADWPMIVSAVSHSGKISWIGVLTSNLLAPTIWQVTFSKSHSSIQNTNNSV